MTLGFLIDKFKERKKLLSFFFLTYLDKVISFAIPLSILLVFKDKLLYNFVEVIFSYATIALTVIELGFSNYLFWGYKNASDKNSFIEGSGLFFKFALTIYLTITSVSALYAYVVHDYNFFLLLVLVCVRTLFTFYTSFYTNIFRLKEIPSKIYVITIGVNVFSLILLVAARFFELGPVIIYFFLPPAGILLFVASKFVLLELRQFSFHDFLKFLKNALRFAWPILLNSLFMSFINNYAKIYAFSYLTPQEMAQISYVLRIGLVVQLTHVSFSSFYSKSLFMDLERKFNFGIFKQYNFVLILSVVVVLFIIALTNFFFSSFIQIPFNLSTILIVIYILLWCYIGYLELYFGVMNANKKMLYYSMISSAIYVIFLRVWGNLTLTQLAILMAATTLLNLILVLVGLVQLKVLTFNQGQQQIE